MGATPGQAAYIFVFPHERTTHRACQMTYDPSQNDTRALLSVDDGEVFTGNNPHASYEHTRDEPMMAWVNCGKFVQKLISDQGEESNSWQNNRGWFRRVIRQRIFP